VDFVLDLQGVAADIPRDESYRQPGRSGRLFRPPLRCSIHKSGNRYAWAPGRSPEDMALPPVPSLILKALKPMRPIRTHSGNATVRIRSVVGIDASPRTLQFLSGKWAEGPGWNSKLFNAACDLCGRSMPLEKAEPLLLAGARPWSVGDAELARKTILSAYSRPREPARR
jgi:hypothetical protein